LKCTIENIWIFQAAKICSLDYFAKRKGVKPSFGAVFLLEETLLKARID
jgi:hypothetical protein